jgi:hypothetical protein
MRGQRAVSADMSSPHARTQPSRGLERIDLVVGPQVVETVLAHARRWEEDHGLSVAARVRLTAVLRAALEHGLRFDPRGIGLECTWVDSDRLRLDLTWHLCKGTASCSVPEGGVEATIATLDTLADEWGFGNAGRYSVHWIVVDTR